MTITIILFILLILFVLIRLYKHIKANKIKDKDTHTGGIRVFHPGEWNNEFTKDDEINWP